ncbi:MAG: hypothetical protein R3Y11_02375 [Pseudomonadota bacterium]
MSSGDREQYDASQCNSELLPEDMERFRMATLRAKIASYGVYAPRDADEDLLYRMLSIAKQRAERRLTQEKKQAQQAKYIEEYFNE